MKDKLKNRLASDQSGFTLIELLVVIVILGILLAIAIPSYMGFRDRAQRSAAQSNIRAVIPAVETYYSDNGTYATMTEAGLQAIDQSIPAGRYTISNLAAADYCVRSTEGNFTSWKRGPAGQVQVAAAGSAGICA